MDKLSEKGERNQTEDKKRERKKNKKQLKNIILFFAPLYVQNQEKTETERTIPKQKELKGGSLSLSQSGTPTAGLFWLTITHRLFQESIGGAHEK